MSNTGVLFSDTKRNITIIIGNPDFIKYLIETMKIALDEGITVETIIKTDKSKHTLIVKIEENEKNIPQDFEELIKYGEKLIHLYTNYGKIYTNLSKLLVYVFFNKCKSQAETNNEGYNICIDQYNYFRKLLSGLLFDKNGYIRFPALEECKRFLNNIFKTEINDECLQKCCFGKEEDIQKCVDKYFDFDKIKSNRINLE